MGRNYIENTKVVGDVEFVGMALVFCMEPIGITKYVCSVEVNQQNDFLMVLCLHSHIFPTLQTHSLCIMLS